MYIRVLFLSPSPTVRWLHCGVLHAQSPFVLLPFVAAAATTFRLQTCILVLPSRNPFITARAVATLDLYPKGRVTLGLGAGYLKAEYQALGVDFERRHEIMDEFLIALKTALRHAEFTFQGSGYEADRTSTRLHSSHYCASRMPSAARQK